jgi:hypothetical protein
MIEDSHLATGGSVEPHIEPFPSVAINNPLVKLKMSIFRVQVEVCQ